MLKVFLENFIRDAVIITIDSNGRLRWFKQVPWQPLFRRKDNFSLPFKNPHKHPRDFPICTPFSEKARKVAILHTPLKNPGAAP